jgi:hypothetical protein
MGGDSDPVAELASRLNRPAASLAAFKGLSDEQLRLLSNAVERASEERRREIDAELERALPFVGRSLLLGLLRGPGIAPVRRFVPGIAPLRRRLVR